MSPAILQVTLQREGPTMNWGFRLQGGIDVDMPLSIQRVFLGTPSEGELHRGDLVLCIGKQNATRLTHQRAYDLIKNSGSTLQLTVQRTTGFHSPASTPSTPNPFTGSHPLAGVCLPPVQSAAQLSFGPSLPTTKFFAQSMYRPVPTTYHEYSRPYTPESISSTEQWENLEQTIREKEAITHQAYRTLPIIMPQAKTRHDYPQGSYMRHVHDPTWKKPNPSTRVNDAIMMAKVQESVSSMAQSSPSMSPGRTPTPESMASGSRVYHRQYNSPINLYSAQAVAETLSGQTGLQPATLREALRDEIMAVGTDISRSSQVRHQPVAKVLPAGRITKLSDVTQSPTYQMIHQTEWKSLNKSQLKEHTPVQNRVYSAPTYSENRVNTFGIPKDTIQQSNSFKTLMSTLFSGDVRQ